MIQICECKPEVSPFSDQLNDKGLEGDTPYYYTSDDHRFHQKEKVVNPVDPDQGQDCHAYTILECAECGEQIKIPIWCGDRLCPICAKDRAEKYKNYLREKIVFMDITLLWFITFTVRNTPILSDGYNNLRRSIHKLMQRAIWKHNFIGGVHSIETTKNKDRNDWHPHQHDLCVSYKEQLEIPIYKGKKIIGWKPVTFKRFERELRKIWEEITPNHSFEIKIKNITSKKRALKELSKYPFKPSNLKDWTEANKFEFRSFMHNKRNFVTFGSWYGDQTEITPSHCPNCGAENSFIVINESTGLPKYALKKKKDFLDRYRCEESEEIKAMKKAYFNSLDYQPLNPIDWQNRSVAECMAYAAQ